MATVAQWFEGITLSGTTLTVSSVPTGTNGVQRSLTSARAIWLTCSANSGDYPLTRINAGNTLNLATYGISHILIPSSNTTSPDCFLITIAYSPGSPTITYITLTPTKGTNSTTNPMWLTWGVGYKFMQCLRKIYRGTNVSYDAWDPYRVHVQVAGTQEVRTGAFLYQPTLAAGTTQTPSGVYLAANAPLTISHTPDSYLITPFISQAKVKLGNVTVGTSPITVNSNTTLTATGIPSTYTITPTITNAEVTFNGATVTSDASVNINSNSTLTVVGDDPNIIITPTIGAGTQVTLNEVELQSNVPITLTENSTLQSSNLIPEATLGITYTNMSSFKINDTSVESGKTVTLNPGGNTLEATGATAVPNVTVNGDNITSLTVNGTEYQPSQLPYTFQPAAGITNHVFVQGADSTNRAITISGTNIASMTVNNTPVTLPYTTVVTEPLNISVSGEVYQVDVSSNGGAIITKDGTIISDGGSLHTILDINKDTFLTVDGTHTLTISGDDIKTITINGNKIDVSDLPYTIQNSKMTASIIIGGYPPSEIHVSGTYIDTATFDGNALPINANGSVDLEVEVREENHFLTIVGSQPRGYDLTFNNHGTSEIQMNGQTVDSGSTITISDSKYIEAEAQPVPLNFDMDGFSIVEINGKPYYEDFTVNVSRETMIDVTSNSCALTIDYGDSSYSITVPQGMVTLTAPHRDGWIFDTWTSHDVGIINPRMVRCNIDLTGVARAHLVANYQRYITCNKPNPWN